MLSFDKKILISTFRNSGGFLEIIKLDILAPINNKVLKNIDNSFLFTGDIA